MFFKKDKWEYIFRTIETIRDEEWLRTGKINSDYNEIDLHNELNELGQNGFELCEVVSYSAHQGSGENSETITQYDRYIFKRKA